jgi:hypothetical protein
MSLSDLITPVVADQLAKFGPGAGGKAAQINYSVPLPGAYSWGRVVPLELPTDWFTPQARNAGTSLLTLGVVQGDQGRLTGIDRDRLMAFYQGSIPATARPSLRLVAEVGGDVEPLLGSAAPRVRAAAGDAAIALDAARDTAGDTAAADASLLARRAILAEPDDVVRQRIRVDSYLERLAGREAGQPIGERMQPLISLPAPGLGNSIRPIPINPVAPALPRLAIIETWELRSYLGDYGLGRTLQTFSLLPGERTTITVETWRTDSATREDSSSIFDSSDTSAQTRFTSALSNASGAAFQDQGGWAASVSTSASASGSFFGIVQGSASVQAGFAANHSEASQRWSSAVSETAMEHAAQVNNSRRQSVQASSSTSSSTGAATTTVRELSNTNLRRVLNFVFRELNQEYDTYVVLRDIKVAFFNGNPRSVDVVSLADLGLLIQRYVEPKFQERAARFVLGLCTQRFDANGEIVTTLEVGANPTGIRYDWAPATLDGDGSLVFDGDPLASNVRWRFATGQLSKDERAVRGVIADRSSVVLRTDNMVVEALLGQADALDPYASALQALDLQNRQSETAARDAQTERTTDALALVSAQASDQRIDAWQKIFPDQPDIEVVPVAAVNNGNNHA